MRRTFYKFLAALSEDDNYHCVICGYYPVILVFDVIRKCNFKLGDKITASEDCLEVNAKEFWDNLEKYAMCPDSNRSLKPSLLNWAPYIPEKSRRGDILWNTEVLKG